MKSEKRRLKDNIPQYLVQLVNLAWDTQNAMFNFEQNRERPSIDIEDEMESEEKFKLLLQRLFYRYEPKFKASSVNISDEVKEQLKEKNVLQLDFNHAKQLCTNIRDLMEDIGHTTFAKRIHEDTTLGGKN